MPPLTCHPIDDCGIACWSQYNPETQLGRARPWEGQTLGEVLIYKGWCELNSSSSQIVYFSLYIAIMAKQHDLCHLRSPQAVPILHHVQKCMWRVQSLDKMELMTRRSTSLSNLINYLDPKP
jgi:hypothetical protein